MDRLNRLNAAMRTCGDVKRQCDAAPLVDGLPYRGVSGGVQVETEMKPLSLVVGSLRAISASSPTSLGERVTAQRANAHPPHAHSHSSHVLSKHKLHAGGRGAKPASTLSTSITTTSAVYIVLSSTSTGSPLRVKSSISSRRSPSPTTVWWARILSTINTPGRAADDGSGAAAAPPNGSSRELVVDCAKAKVST